MKLLKNIMLFTAAVAFAACDSDIDTVQIASPSDFVAPVIGQCNDVIVNADNVKAESVVFTWSAADFGLPVEVLYSLYFTNGTATTLAGTTSSTVLALSKSDVNGAVINGLGIAANETVSIQAYVTAKVSGTSSVETVSSGMSNSFKVSTFEAPLGELYLCGEFNEWKEGEAPIFYETTGGSNIYKCMVDMSQTSGSDPNRSYFKVLTAQSWTSGENWGYNYLTPSWKCPEQSDSNLSVPLSEGCVFELTINKALMTIDKKAVGNKLGLTGDDFDWGNSGTPDAFFTYDYMTSSWKTDPIALTGGSGVKVRVDSGWDTNWGATGESTAIAGGVELGKGDNITVPSSGTFVVVLHANRTPYVLEFVAQ